MLYIFRGYSHHCAVSAACLWYWRCGTLHLVRRQAHTTPFLPERGWCERLVDVASPDSPLHLRLVLSPGPTPASRLLVPRRLKTLAPDIAESILELEICPQVGSRSLGQGPAHVGYVHLCTWTIWHATNQTPASSARPLNSRALSPQGMAVAEKLAQRIATSRGAALLIDYGQDGPYGSSLLAIQKHKFTGLLEMPGTADISARVDFSALRAAVEGAGCGVAAYGPITQASFLMGLGMGARLDALLRGATPEQAEDLVRGFERLIGVPGMPGDGDAQGGRVGALQEDGMGISYKAMCLASPDLQQPPAPFDVLHGREPSTADDDQ